MCVGGLRDWALSVGNALYTGSLLDGKPRTDAARRAAVDKMFAAYARNFPDVSTISPAELERELALAAEPDADRRMLLVDCRPETERISTIAGSVAQADFDASAVPLETDVVVMCTVGYRSGVFGQKLQQEQPGRRVANLRGGILLWAHDVGDVVDHAGAPSETVHVYGKPWNLLPDRFTAVVSASGASAGGLKVLRKARTAQPAR